MGFEGYVKAYRELKDFEGYKDYKSLWDCITSQQLQYSWYLNGIAES